MIDVNYINVHNVTSSEVDVEFVGRRTSDGKTRRPRISLDYMDMEQLVGIAVRMRRRMKLERESLERREASLARVFSEAP